MHLLRFGRPLAEVMCKYVPSSFNLIKTACKSLLSFLPSAHGNGSLCLRRVLSSIGRGSGATFVPVSFFLSGVLHQNSRLYAHVFGIEPSISQDRGNNHEGVGRLAPLSRFLTFSYQVSKPCPVHVNCEGKSKVLNSVLPWNVLCPHTLRLGHPTWRGHHRRGQYGHTADCDEGKGSQRAERWG